MNKSGKLFRITFFGFKKNDVFKYIHDFNKEANESIEAARKEGVDAIEEVEILRNKINYLENVNKELKNKITSLESQILSLQNSLNEKNEEKKDSPHTIRTNQPNNVIMKKTPSKTLTIDTKKILSFLPNIKIK